MVDVFISCIRGIPGTLVGETGSAVGIAFSRNNTVFHTKALFLKTLLLQFQKYVISPSQLTGGVPSSFHWLYSLANRSYMPRPLSQAGS